MYFLHTAAVILLYVKTIKIFGFIRELCNTHVEARGGLHAFRRQVKK